MSESGGSRNSPFHTARSRSASDRVMDVSELEHLLLEEHERREEEAPLQDPLHLDDLMTEEHEDEEDRISIISTSSDEPTPFRDHTIRFDPDALEVEPDSDEMEVTGDEETTTPPPSPKPIAVGTPDKMDLARVTLEFLISEGFKEPAEALCAETGIELPKEEAEHLDARVTIREAIEEGRVDEAIEKMSELCPSLMTDNPEIRFHLMQQNLIEMIRKGETERALEYAQNEIAVDDNLQVGQLERLEKTFALLAFEKPETSPFGKLLDQSHRQMVSTEVNGAVLRALAKPSAPRADALFKMMIWAQQQIQRATQGEGEEPFDPISTAHTLFGQSTSV